MYKSEWRQVFILAAEIYVFGAFVYVILGRGDKQWWAEGVSTTAINQDEKERLMHSEDYTDKKMLQKKFEEELVAGTGEMRKGDGSDPCGGVSVRDSKRNSGGGTRVSGTVSIQHPSFK